jgi:hypothetical protein
MKLSDRLTRAAVPSTPCTPDPARLVEIYGPVGGHAYCRRIDQLSSFCRYPIEFAASISSYMVARGERLRLAA